MLLSRKNTGKFKNDDEYKVKEQLHLKDSKKTKKTPLRKNISSTKKKTGNKLTLVNGMAVKNVCCVSLY